jgi:serine/threonine-protein kinase
MEPFVRRRWPQMLISWTRLVSGDWRDPLVARDMFIGFACGILCLFIWTFLRSYVDIQPTTFSFNTVLGARFFISSLLIGFIFNLFSTLFGICLLYLLAVLLRNQKAAFAALLFIQVLLNALQSTVIWTYPSFLAIFSLFLILLIRFGIIAAISANVVQSIFQNFPVTYDTSAWYAETGFAALAILAVIVLYAFRTSLIRRPRTAPSGFDA